MGFEDTILRQFPYSLAKSYESVCLQEEPQLHVIKSMDLFEDIVRYLSLVGLAKYNHYGLKDPAVEKDRARLKRPSLGHWINLLRGVSKVLREIDPDCITIAYEMDCRKDPIEESAQALAEVAEIDRCRKDDSFGGAYLVNYYGKLILNYTSALHPTESPATVLTLTTALDLHVG